MVKRARPSRRIPLKKKYNIQKKIKENKRKKRKLEKKSNKLKSKKPKLIVVPNECPFKIEILNDIEQLKKLDDEEKLEIKERLKELKQEKENGVAQGSEEESSESEDDTIIFEKTPSSLNGKEYKKVMEDSDIILEVVDARDPMGTRCIDVEKTMNSLGKDKRLILILNKADLVPSNILMKWIEHFRKSYPTFAFKGGSFKDPANDPKRRKHSGKHNFKNFDKRKPNVMKPNCIGAKLLLKVLQNFCDNNSTPNKILVGVVGMPNVGKSCVTNALLDKLTCQIGFQPGTTKNIQRNKLNGSITLIDSPGIQFDRYRPQKEVLSMLNMIISMYLGPPTEVASAIVKKMNKNQIGALYNVYEYSSELDLFTQIAKMKSFLKKKASPDVEAAAKLIIKDWNIGKILHYTEPVPENKSRKLPFLNEEIMAQFGLKSLNSLEEEVMKKFKNRRNLFSQAGVIIKSAGPFRSSDSHKKNVGLKNNKLKRATKKKDIKKKKRKGEKETLKGTKQTENGSEKVVKKRKAEPDIKKKVPNKKIKSK